MQERDIVIVSRIGQLVEDLSVAEGASYDYGASLIDEVGHCVSYCLRVVLTQVFLDEQFQIISLCRRFKSLIHALGKASIVDITDVEGAYLSAAA